MKENVEANKLGINANDTITNIKSCSMEVFIREFNLLVLYSSHPTALK